MMILRVHWAFTRSAEILSNEAGDDINPCLRVSKITLTTVTITLTASASIWVWWVGEGK